MSVNKVILVGNVGKDPECKMVGESKLAKFPLATSESYKNKSGERITNTEWHNITVWRGLAEVVEKYVVKGSQLYIEGQINYKSYDDKDGNKKYFTEIKCEQLRMIGSKPKEAQTDSNPQQGGADNLNPDKFPDDIPF
jgi:single-strand DNA-binding protein